MRHGTVRPAFALLVGALIVVSAAVRPVAARPGDRDPGFGIDGLVTTDFGGVDAAYGLAVQPDGRILASGNADAGGDQFRFALARYLPDGRRDATYGRDGLVTTAIGASDATATAMAFQPNGATIVAGYAITGDRRDIAIVRYGADGSLDTTFGAGGVTVTTNPAGPTIAKAVAVLRDGRILVAATRSGGEAEVVLIRYTFAGVLDQGFGQAGFARLALNSERFDAANVSLNLSLEPGDRVRISGLAGDGVLSVVADAEGVVQEARRVSLTGALERTNALVRRDDGRILTAGVAGGRFAVAAFESDGARDQSFGVDGLVSTDLQNERTAAYAIVVAPNGTLLVAGESALHFVLARYSGSPPRPSVAPETVLLADRFDDPARGALPIAIISDYVRTGYNNGEYQIAGVSSAAVGAPYVALPGSYTDTTLTVDARVVGETDQRHFTLYCRTSGERFTFLDITLSSGEVVIWRATNYGASQTPMVFPPAESIRRGNASNRFQLSCSGATISATANGVLIASLEDDGAVAFGGAALGCLALLPGQPTCDVRLDNLTLTQATPGAALTGAGNNSGD